MDRATLVTVSVLLGLALLILLPDGSRPAAGDPAGVASDRRLEQCGGATGDVQYAFTIPSARDYRVYLPAMGRSLELELDPGALIVVFRRYSPFRPAAGPTSSTGASPTAARSSGLHDVCVYVGEAGAGELNVYRDISTAGMRATVDGPVLDPGAP
jgi:hypothetical protein